MRSGPIRQKLTRLWVLVCRMTFCKNVFVSLENFPERPSIDINLVHANTIYYSCSRLCNCVCVCN